MRYRLSTVSAIAVMCLGQPPANDCAGNPTMRLLDFWVGDWVVTDAAGTTVGTNRIERVLNGCAITELWHDPDGAETRAMLYYHSGDRLWKLVLITENALAPGGIRERHLVARLSGGGVRFLGEIRDSAAVVLNRMTLTPLPGGGARELIDSSRDGGTTWRVVFDGLYVKKRKS